MEKEEHNKIFDKIINDLSNKDASGGMTADTFLQTVVQSICYSSDSFIDALAKMAVVATSGGVVDYQVIKNSFKEVTKCWYGESPYDKKEKSDLDNFLTEYYENKRR